MNKDLKEFLKSFNAQKIEYMISLADLKKNKKASGRHKDLEDIENLP